MSTLQRLALVGFFVVAAAVFTLGALSRWGAPERRAGDPAPTDAAAPLAPPTQGDEREAIGETRRLLSGRVVHASGAAAAGAEVVLLDAELDTDAALEAAVEGNVEGVLARLTADDDGAFRTLVDPALARLQIVARASLGHLPVPVAVERGPDEWPSVRVGLERGADLVVAGAPAGAVLVRADASEGALRARGTPLGTRRFEVDGASTLVVVGLRPGVDLEVLAIPTSAAAARERVDELTAGETRTVVVANEPGDTFAGRVVDAAGNGVGGAQVVLTWPVEPGRRGDEVGRAVSATDGSFTVGRVPARELVGQVRADGFAALDFWVPMPGPRRSAGGFVLELGSGARLAGRVVLPSGEPAVGCAVEVEAERGESTRAGAPELRTAVTGADGRFEALGLDGRVFKVVAHLEREALPQLRAVARMVEPGAPVELALAATHTLEIVATRPDGTPLDAVAIEGRLLDGRTTVQAPGQSFERESLAADGRHPIDGLLAGPWSLRLSARGLAPFDDLVVQLPRAEPLAVVFEAGAAISGRVLAPDGTPVAGGRVLAWSTRPQGVLIAAREREAAVTDADGRFELRDLRAGTLHLAARHPDHASSDWTELALEAGQRVSDVELALRTGAVLTGRVVDESGAPLAGRWVVCHSVESWDPVRVRTDEKGTFRADSLVAGEWQVIALGLEDDDPGRVAVSELLMQHVQLVEGGTHHVELGGVAETSTVLEGLASFAPVGRNNWVQVVPEAEGGMLLARIQDDGSFRTAVPRPGPHLLSILVDKGIERGSELLVTTEVPTADGRPYAVETPSARIAGRVVDAAGAGVAGVQVRVECEGLLLPGTQLTMRFAFDVTADDGRFAFELLPPGTYRVSAGGQPYVEGAPARPRHGLATLRDIALAAGEDRSDLVLVTDEPRTVEGSVVDANGRPVVGASIHVRTAAGVFAHELALVHSDAQGQFRYEGLPPGPLAFGALADGWASPDLVAEQDGRVRLELVPSGRLVVEFRCPQGGILSLRGEDGDELAGRGDVRRLAGEERLRWRSDAIEFDDLAPGRYAVELRPFGASPQTKYVQVAAGEERRVVLTAR